MDNYIKKKELRDFSLIFGIGLPVIVGVILPLIYGHTFRAWTLWIGILSICLGIFKPRILTYPYKAWMAIGHFLGKINSRIILGLVFILVVQPIAIIMKIFKYDPLRKKFEKKKSYREIKKYHKIDLTRIF